MGAFYLAHEYWFAASQLFLAMLGMGATLRVEDFAAVARAPTGMAAGLLTQLVSVPLLALAVGRLFALSRWCIRGSLCVIGMMVIGGAGAGRIDPAAYGWVTPLAIVVFSVLCMNAGILLSRLMRLPRRDRIAVGIEAGVRNTNLALLIKASVFPAELGVVDPIGDGAFFVALLYGGVALFVVLTPLLLHRRLEGALGR